MTTLSSRRLGHAARRRGAVAAGLAALVGVFVVATAVPAFAHHPEVAGETTCTNGDHVISWTIGNSETDKGMHIVSATATLGADSFPTTGYSDVGPSGSTPATTVVPGSKTGTVTLTVDALWTDNYETSASGSVTLMSTCAPATTTTTTIPNTSTTVVTSTTQPTTSTTAPVTSTTVATTSTTVASTSTTQPTTTTTEQTTGSTVTTSPSTIPPTTTVPGTPIVTEGSTVPPPTTAPWWHGSGTPSTTSPTGVAVAGSPSPSPSTGPGSSRGSLPFTGSSDVGPMIGVSSLMTGALVLLLTRRKRRTL